MNQGTVKASQIVILAVLIAILAVGCLLLGFVVGADSSTGPDKQLDRAACDVQLPTLSR